MSTLSASDMPMKSTRQAHEDQKLQRSETTPARSRPQIRHRRESTNLIDYCGGRRLLRWQLWEGTLSWHGKAHVLAKRRSDWQA